ncbi:hypothetical protein DAEQUDRAFT_743979 [Daedalea quercina L-15889]|uniref:TPR-like protein n=1 Tax=Daedalea quercina L-15889 TaxID=1314783 RepID=A0A165SF75_9APHY|nr:hypothetical protein DAEQUDRAFT_743979 [Daedalea quercina L-15889]
MSLNASVRSTNVLKRTLHPSSSAKWNITLNLPWTRSYTNLPFAQWTRSNSRISTVFTVLLAVGLGSTAYGVYEFYSMFTMWPQEVRGDLRAGIKAKNHDDFSLSERYLRRAYDTALTLPLDTFSPSPHLKLSGIAIALASTLEAADRPEPAYEVYSDALSRLRAANAASPLSGPERMRAVAIASKLGEMAETYQLPVAEEERWLTYAVEELLRVVRDGAGHPKLVVEGEAQQQQDETPMMLAELEMPPWVTKTDVGAPLEALGRFYAREGNVEYAVPLYLQAISLLVPPVTSTKKSTPEERCRGAQLMNNLAELSIRGKQTDEKRAQAIAWAQQGLATIERTKASGGSPEELWLCEQTLAAVLFNLGSLHEIGNDTDRSRELFKQSLDQAKAIRMREGVMEAQAALRRLDRIAKRVPTPTADAANPSSPTSN